MEQQTDKLVASVELAASQDIWQADFSRIQLLALELAFTGNAVGKLHIEGTISGINWFSVEEPIEVQGVDKVEFVKWDLYPVVRLKLRWESTSGVGQLDVYRHTRSHE